MDCADLESMQVTLPIQISSAGTSDQTRRFETKLGRTRDCRVGEVDQTSFFLSLIQLRSPGDTEYSLPFLWPSDSYASRQPFESNVAASRYISINVEIVFLAVRTSQYSPS